MQWYSYNLAGAAMGRSGVEVGSSHIHATNDEIGSNVTLSNQTKGLSKKFSNAQNVAVSE
jgi:hypothetical protein